MQKHSQPFWPTNNDTTTMAAMPNPQLGKALMRQEVAFFENNSSGALVSRCAKKNNKQNPWEEWIWHHKKSHHRTSHFWILLFFFWEFMHVKGHAMFKFRCFWNCSFIAHMFLAWFLQSWKLARFFIVTGWPMILISFKMSGAQFTLIMASSHQSISFFFGWKYMGVTLENLDAAAILSHQHLWSVGDFQTFWSSKIAYWL